MSIEPVLHSISRLKRRDRRRAHGETLCSPAHANAHAPWYAPTAPVVAHASLARATKDKIGAFQRIVRDAGFACFARITRGDDDAAACGQLATKSRKAVKA